MVLNSVGSSLTYLIPDIKRNTAKHFKTPLILTEIWESIKQNIVLVRARKWW